MNTLNFSILTTTTNQCKSFGFQNNVLTKNAAADSFSGTFHIKTGSFEDFATTIQNLTTKQSIILGRPFKNNELLTDTVKMTTVSKRTTDTIARCKENLVNQGPGIVVFDFDTATGNITKEDCYNNLIKVIPELNGVAHIIKASSSSFITAPNGVSTGPKGWHIFFPVVDMADIERFASVVWDRQMIDFGRFELTNGTIPTVVERGLWDKSVTGRPERLLFEATPICKDGVVCNAPKVEFVDGSVLDTATVVANSEIDYAAIRGTKREEFDGKVYKPAKEKALKQYKEQIKLEPKNKNKTDKQIEKEFYNLTHHTLNSEFVLNTKKGPMTVGQLVINQNKFDKLNMADPMEPEYNSGSLSQAQYYYNNGKPAIFSQAHGGILYDLLPALVYVNNFCDHNTKIFMDNDELVDFVKPGDIYLDTRGLGAGKTNLMVALSKKFENLGKKVFVSPRVSLVDDGATRLEYNHYQKPQNGSNDTLAVCINSLAKHVQPEKQCGILFVDEIRQVLESLYTGTVSAYDKKAVEKTLIDTINNAEIVVLADAGTNQYVLDWVLKNTTKNIVQICDKKETNKPNVVVVENQNSLLQLIVDSEGPVFVATDSKKQATVMFKYLTEKFDTKDMLLVTSDTMSGTAQQAFLKDINNESVKYQCVIHSPVISSGVSITNHHFKNTYASFVGVLVENEMVQTIMRNRTAKNIIVSADCSNKNALADATAWLQGAVITIGNEQIPGNVVKDKWLKNYAILKTTRNAASNHTATRFQILLEQMGFSVTTTNVDTTISTKKLAKEINENNISTVVHAENLTTEDYIMLKEKVIIPSDLKPAVEKFRIAKTLCLQPSEICVEHVDFVNKKHGGSKISLYETLHEKSGDKLMEKDAMAYEFFDYRSKVVQNYLGATVLDMITNHTTDKLFSENGVSEICTFLKRHHKQCAVNKLGNFMVDGKYPIKHLNEFLDHFGYTLIKSKDKFKKDEVRTFKLVVNQLVVDAVKRKETAKAAAEVAMEALKAAMELVAEQNVTIQHKSYPTLSQNTTYADVLKQAKQRISFRDKPVVKRLRPETPLAATDCPINYNTTYADVLAFSAAL